MNILNPFQLKIIDIIEKQHSALWKNPHILGFGRGLKFTNSHLTTTPCLTIFVKKKLPQDCLDSSRIIPSKIDGVPTDVIELGKVLQQSGEIRPAVGGISISNAYRKGGGTLTYAVTDYQNKLYLLSCSHVLCRDIVNVIYNDKIIQPSISRGGFITTSSMAVLNKWIPLKISKNPPSNFHDYNEVDAAIALVNYNLSCNQKTLLSPKLLDGTIIRETTSIEPGSSVWKIGASTQKTYGKVLSVNTVYFIENPYGRAFFKNQIIVDMKSTFGDSGALGIDQYSNKAFGMLIAGSQPNATFFSPIDKVLDLLNIRLALPLA